MAIKQYKPTTPGRRGASVVDFSKLDKVKPLAQALEGMKEHSGRNNTGRITIRHQGGGARRHYRLIDWRRDKLDIVGKVEFIEPETEGEDAICKFDFDIWDQRLVIQLSEDKLFQSMIGDILIGLIEKQLADNEVVYTGGV